MQSSSLEAQISKDIPRTKFYGKKSSRNAKILNFVLNTYALNTGLYTQGMNYTCALIIMCYPRLHAGQILKKFNTLMNIEIGSGLIVKDIYIDDFPGLKYIFSEIMSRLHVDLVNVLQNSGVHLEHFAVGWVITLLSCQFNPRLCKQMLKNLFKFRNFGIYIEYIVEVIIDCIKQTDFLEWELLGETFYPLLLKFKEKS